MLADVLPESNRDALTGLNVLLTKFKVKRGLKELGMKERDATKLQIFPSVAPTGIHETLIGHRFES